MDRLAAMETFVRVVETGSFSAAARTLNVGQPAVSKTVANLEERLGVRLLMRSTRALSPTEAGQNFYDHAKRAIEEANEADMVARGAGASLTGRLRISAAVTFARLHVVPRLPTFLAAHPDLTMDVILDDRVIDLIEEGVDVALRMGTLADSSLTVRKLASAPRCVVGTAAYFARAGVPATPAELAEHSVVVYVPDSPGDTYTFRQGATELSVSVSGRLRVSCGRGRAGWRHGRHRRDDRLGLDVQFRTRVGRGTRGAEGLDAAVDRFVRSLPDGPDAKRQGPCVRCLRRSGVGGRARGAGEAPKLAGASDVETPAMLRREVKQGFKSGY